jgi:murein L,D-transpeptidase YafK
VSAGGDIMIHGLPKAFAMIGALHRQQDWTLGCVAVTNEEIEEIWRAVPDGARILIRP